MPGTGHRHRAPTTAAGAETGGRETGGREVGWSELGWTEMSWPNWAGAKPDWTEPDWRETGWPETGWPRTGLRCQLAGGPPPGSARAPSVAYSRARGVERRPPTDPKE